MKTLAILTNGGDTCALNASIRSIRDSAYQVGYKKIYGVRRGYQGLLDWSLEDITDREIDPRIGGSCLGSLRISPTREVGGKYEVDREKCTRMAQTLADYRIGVLVVIGGDGTLQATKAFQEWAQAERVGTEGPTFKLLGFLKTIDNDIQTGTFFKGMPVSLCPGFPSAVEKIVSSVRALRVTARTAERAFCVETMGRDAGWLAAAGSFGGAEIVLIPELEEFFTEKNPRLVGDHVKLSNLIWERLADLLAGLYRRNRNVIVSIAEGFQPDFGDVDDARKFARIIKNLYGDRKQVGATELVAMILSPVLNLYFSALSRLEKNGLTPEKIGPQIDRALSECPGQREKYNEKVSSGHPLRNWPVAKKLEQELALDDRGTSASHEQQGTTEPVTEESQPLTSEGSPPGQGQRQTGDWGAYRISRPPYRFEIRPHRTDYVPRSGAPSAYDYKLATVLGWKIGEMLRPGNEQWGYVPRLKEVLPYDRLSIDLVEPVSIDEIRTLPFDNAGYFDIDTLHVSDKITDFFRTITTGPENLDTAIAEVDALCKKLPTDR